jgi:hypothetical protein
MFVPMGEGDYSSATPENRDRPWRHPGMTPQRKFEKEPYPTDFFGLPSEKEKRL